MVMRLYSDAVGLRTLIDAALSPECVARDGLLVSALVRNLSECVAYDRLLVSALFRNLSECCSSVSVAPACGDWAGCWGSRCHQVPVC